MKKMSKAKISLIVYAIVLFILLLYWFIDYLIQPNGVKLIMSNCCLIESLIATIVASHID